jgi:hypothetical protein
MPFSLSPGMQSNIRQIQEVFAEHRPLSYKEWVDGFISDAHPEHEIAIWLDAANTYVAFTKEGLDAVKRRDIFRVIAACLTGMKEYAIALTTNTLKPSAISQAEAETIVNHYYKLREARLR